MNKITTTALAAAALTLIIPMPAADAKTIFIAGTAPPGVSTHVADSDYTWATGLPVTDEVYIVQYPRALAPLSGDQMLWQSVHAGASATRPHLENGDSILAISQGALVAEQIKRWAVADGITNLTIVTYGDPNNHDGGILTKLWGVPTAPVLPPTEQPDGYQQVTYAIEYEFVADAPDVGIWKNPLAWANSAMSGIYDHPTYNQALIDRAAAEGRLVKTVDEYGTHYLIKQVNLPLTRPLRDVERFLTGQTALTDGIDRVLKPIINSGYTGNRTVTLPPGPAPTHGEVPKSVPGDDNPTKGSDTASGNEGLAKSKPKTSLKDVVADAAKRLNIKLGNKFSPGDTVADKETGGVNTGNEGSLTKNESTEVADPAETATSVDDNPSTETE